MLNTSVSPNAVKECSLWQVLENEVSPKYSLSQKACEGILRRAETRSKTLPDLLRVALERIANPTKAAQLKLQGGALSGGSETLVVHGTQDPIISQNKAHCLGRNNGQENVLFEVKGAEAVRISEIQDKTPTLKARMGTGGNNIPCIAKPPFTIRKLTPRECERLQGFPDDWTKIPYRSKSAEECPDSPRYKAIGNSMAVPCMRWIGLRLNNYLVQSL